MFLRLNRNGNLFRGLFHVLSKLYWQKLREEVLQLSHAVSGLCGVLLLDK